MSQPAGGQEDPEGLPSDTSTSREGRDITKTKVMAQL